MQSRWVRGKNHFLEEDQSRFHRPQRRKERESTESLGPMPFELEACGGLCRKRSEAWSVTLRNQTGFGFGCARTFWGKWAGERSRDCQAQAWTARFARPRWGLAELQVSAFKAERDVVCHDTTPKHFMQVHVPVYLAMPSHVSLKPSSCSGQVGQQILACAEEPCREHYPQVWAGSHPTLPKEISKLLRQEPEDPLRPLKPRKPQSYTMRLRLRPRKP